jgi:hypothetical protein
LGCNSLDTPLAHLRDIFVHNSNFNPLFTPKIKKNEYLPVFQDSGGANGVNIGDEDKTTPDM